MVKRSSKFIIKCFSNEFENDMALRYIFRLFDIDIYYREMLHKAQVIISNLNLNQNNELYSKSQNKLIKNKWSTRLFNKLNNEYMDLIIVKRLSGHKSIYEIRLDGANIYPRILFTIYDEQTVMTFGVTKRPQTKGIDGIMEKINDLASESEMLIKAISDKKQNRIKYLGRGDEIVEIQF
ncbi:hypothetical protein [Companilactobacillus kimchii]|uniref:Uncharacterized protein n=2 Tax=Companilactobacillus kimchii TaxID=2801452 RepID=A0ABR5NR96_9LACO|nr:hypothetical protein [Companilactobacillus kimchii]GEO47984.1 hypothetical protein LKI01_19830 [Companilactobacillus paralimentarius]KAE9557296.1 hypothetical protein ATN91_03905 [Companilactobacillus kimchii]KAE9559237.1 hypothetical protein ATN91_11335 [Companilactobacillus kimchii]KRK50512.1 hypothetical protein FC97_GL001435 [Companilactobacillus kimchii DSM 13961 = JCM 10707]OWF33754.1 hypothetical protein LKACC12383_00894 [Companilactobacillus kimchii]